jgi:hypothetical protein
MPGTDFDLADWADLPPLDDADLPAEPPPVREYTGGIMIGSEVSSVLFAEANAMDVGAALCNRGWLRCNRVWSSSPGSEPPISTH